MQALANRLQVYPVFARCTSFLSQHYSSVASLTHNYSPRAIGADLVTLLSHPHGSWQVGASRSVPQHAARARRASQTCKGPWQHAVTSYIVQHSNESAKHTHLHKTSPCSAAISGTCTGRLWVRHNRPLLRPNSQLLKRQPGCVGQQPCAAGPPDPRRTRGGRHARRGQAGLHVNSPGDTPPHLVHGTAAAVVRAGL